MTFLNKPKYSQGYRPDIDGLRAIAVLSVILFHINKAILPGGFVGVDVFFVISGYLISLHILRDIEKDSFSLVEFYRRRIKRILPAMLVVVAFVLLFSNLFFRLEDAEKVARSGFYSLFSLANVYFWLFQDTSYFAAASNESPLLHLWSLGVEEQFYLFWPLILMVIYRTTTGISFLIIFTLVALASFLLGEYLYDTDPSFVYYMLPTRLGELLIGALVAHTVIREGSRIIPTSVVTLIAVLGGICIGGSLLLLSDEHVFPGVRAIPPTIGAALLILAGHYGSSLPSRLLMFRPLVWMGLISYSAYLWHWPLLAFFHYSRLEMSLLNGVIIFGLTILLAWLTYRYVERPTRRYNGSAMRVFSFYFAIPVSILVIVTLIIMKTDGYGLRWNIEEYKATTLKTLPPYKYDYVCQYDEVKAEHLNASHCVVGDNAHVSPSVLLWGDSNAAHYVGMLGVFAREGGFQFKNLEHSSCPPINVDPTNFVPAKRLKDCRNSLIAMKKSVDMFQVFIISSSWTYYQARSDDFFNIFFDNIKQLADQGKLIILLGKVPVISTYDRLCNEKSISLSFMECGTGSNVRISQDVAEVNLRLKDFALKTKNVEYYDIVKYLCPNGICSAFNKNGEAIYYDSSHLSLSASWEIGADIYQQSGVPFPFTLIPRWSRAEIKP